MHVDRVRYRIRTNGLAVQTLGDELLVYDRTGDIAHCLTPSASLVWHTCEGEGATLDELTNALLAAGAGELRTREEAVEIAERTLTELHENRLLATASGGLSRRHVLKAGAIGAGALAAPLVVSAAVPRSAAAFGSPATCGGNSTACTTKNSFGTSASNTCCGPGVKSCPAASGSGSGGCFCGSTGVCVNCVGTGSQPSATTCSSGACANGSTAANPCCCSGVCNGGHGASAGCA